MNPEESKTRTKKFALRVLNLADQLPRGFKGRILSDQIARAGTSAAANYRAACKARSRAEFIAKRGVAEEEADEVQFWLELICENNLVPAHVLTDPSAGSARIDGHFRGIAQIGIARPEVIWQLAFILTRSEESSPAFV
jgi:four helix bundle protein